ncbi:hypothetical protein DL765_000785 [Monosporascus sp. GIB2]|nr:hypothetical protein DL765_000785 [Monosporascus sp. GIB2]
MSRSSPFFSEWEPGVIETRPTDSAPTVTSDFDTSYTPPVETVTWNDPAHSAVKEYTKDCWITEEDWIHGYDPEAYNVGCQNLFNTYCVYNPESPSPKTLSRAPVACTPDRSWYTIAPDPDPVHTPSPVQSGITKGCNKFYKVKNGDTCDGVTRSNGVSLADFYKWNPSVGDDCRNLQLDTYVCIGFDKRLVPTITPPPARR